MRAETRETVRTGLALFLITFAAAAVFGVVNLMTKDVIAENAKAAKRHAISEILTVHENNFSDDVPTGNEAGVIIYNTGYGEDGEPCGYVFEVLVKGYAGDMAVFVGINLSGRITGVSLGRNSETPGLGKNAGDPFYVGQFTGKEGPFSVVKRRPSAQHEVEAVAAATITSVAIANAVNQALDYFNENLKGF